MESPDIIIGEREVWGTQIPFGISRASRRHHTYAIGQTGVGKSTMLFALLQQDIASGDGCTFIDPHGDAARAILASVPARRID
jgi:type IV secretory pathway VirB4 component